MANDDHSQQEMMSQLLALRELIADKLILFVEDDSSGSELEIYGKSAKLILLPLLSRLNGRMANSFAGFWPREFIRCLT